MDTHQPDTTGTPNIGGLAICNTVTDVPFALCGNSYKIARSWFVIEWCTTQSLTKNQIIHIKDIGTKGNVHR
ncbi:MAG: hypothetical protein IPJ39_13400 [Saprospiraceae bacterium]|nr:hypothetical protein [Saprospiraceae bacterium]